MIKCKVIEEFNLKEFNKLNNIKRIKLDTKGKLYIGDTFECDKEMAEYLTGNNKDNKVVVKILNVKPKKSKK